MINLKEVSIHITVEAVETTPQYCSLSSTDKHLRCNLWTTCNNQQCFKHGCLNAIRKQSQEVQS